MVTCLLAAAVLATAGVLGWRSRQTLLAETDMHGQVIARLLARSAAFGAHVMNDAEAAIGEQMVVEATIAAHLVAVAEAAGLAPEEINRRLGAITDETVLDEFWITDENGHVRLPLHRRGV
jgi:sigma-B regulation protein RsbU (phosphoserine phosphatase)